MGFDEVEKDSIDPWVLDDELWEELIELTNGAAAACFQCGACTATCPWGLVREETFSVRKLIRRAQIGLKDEQEILWLCTACSQCELYCPRNVPIAEVIQALRYLIWKRRNTLPGLSSLLWSVYWNNNPWDQPPSYRAHWAAALDLPDYKASDHEFLFYVGCTSSYDQRAQKVARSLIRIFKASDVSFGILGNDEPCCGEAVLSLGHKPYFDDIVKNASHAFRDKGVRRLVTISPHCYDVFKNHYSDLDEAFEPLHYTQFLGKLIEENRLPVQHSLDLKVTFHDPCYLGRKNQVFVEPRRILEALPGVDLVEMESHGQDGLCCGGGGGRMWMETPVGERFSDLRVRQAVSTGADVIATACPFCIACLDDSIKALNVEALEVMDVAEITSRTLLDEA